MPSVDRNFDDLAERFENRIYGGLKGDVRLAVINRELDWSIEQLSKGAPLSVLDIGCGLAQHAIRLAVEGHKVTANDVSKRLLSKAKSKALEQSAAITWYESAFQNLPIESASQDLLLSHAVVEWLENPAEIFSCAQSWLRPQGILSLSFYNPYAKEYRNLIRGNFDWLNNPIDYVSDSGSLTPNAPPSYETISTLAKDHGFQELSSAGIRVFSDYVVEKRGGLSDEDQVLAMELAYSKRDPFKWLGRYLHVLLQKK